MQHSSVWNFTGTISNWKILKFADSHCMQFFLIFQLLYPATVSLRKDQHRSVSMITALGVFGGTIMTIMCGCTMAFFYRRARPNNQVFFIDCLTPKSDWHLISPYNITLKSHIKVMRIKEMVTNKKSSGLWNKFSSSAPEEMYEEQ